jgi:hypothetical protein
LITTTVLGPRFYNANDPDDWPPKIFSSIAIAGGRYSRMQLIAGERVLAFKRLLIALQLLVNQNRGKGLPGIQFALA